MVQRRVDARVDDSRVGAAAAARGRLHAAGWIAGSDARMRAPPLALRRDGLLLVDRGSAARRRSRAAAVTTDRAVAATHRRAPTHQRTSTPSAHRVPRRQPDGGPRTASTAEAYPGARQRTSATTTAYDYEVVNAGVSGDTSAGGLRRLDWALEGDVRVLIVALGGNDGLRGLPADELQQNLATIIERAQARRHRAWCSPAWRRRRTSARDYTRDFRAVYPDLAQDAPRRP